MNIEPVFKHGESPEVNPVGTLEKYNHCMVFAGGGFQFGIYLGMHAAACDAGKAPDVIIATCGGALAAQIVCALPDAHQRKQWLASKELYQFWCTLTSSKRATIAHTIAGVVRRRLSKKIAPVVPDIFEDYLFEIPSQLPLPPLPGVGLTPRLVVVGSEVLFTADQVGQLRGQRELFRQVVFCDSRSASLIQGAESAFSQGSWGNHAIARELSIDTTTPLDIAARISIGDMLYFRCLEHAGRHYVGGLIDLFPLDIARRLSNCVSMEYKSSFDQNLAIPMFRAFMGFDANRRLREVNRQVIDYRIDTSDVDSVFAKATIKKRVDLLRNQIRIELPATHQAYIADIDAQWQFGYTRAMEAFKGPAGQTNPKIRLVTKHN
jgi:hypothetical protein